MTRSSYEASLEQRHRRLEQGRRNRGGVNPTSVKLRGTDYAHHITFCPPTDFQTFRHSYIHSFFPK